VPGVLSWFQATVLGVVQGVTELSPVSSLGHAVETPKLAGWNLVGYESASSENFYLAFLVTLHVATALALFIYFFAEWRRILAGLWRSARRRRLAPADADERLAWLLVAATVPAGLTGLVLEHPLRTLFAKPTPAAAFLTVNGIILLLGEALRRRANAFAPGAPVPATQPIAGGATDRPPRAWSTLLAKAPAEQRLATLRFREAIAIGFAQILALLPGISRSGITMVAGLARGLDYVDAARFSFLLATPIIAAAGVFKLPLLLGPEGHAIRGQALVGGLCAGVSAYLSVRFLMRYFQTNRLSPFGLYSLVVGIALLIYFAG